MLILGGLAVAGGAMVIDWSPGERHPLPLSVARERVTRVRFDRGLVRDTASPPALSTDAAGEHIRWTYTWQPGRPASWCEATLTAAGDAATRSSLRCGVADPRDPLVARRAGELLRLIVHEHVAAALDARPFDNRKMGIALMTFAVLHRQELADRAAAQR